MMHPVDAVLATLSAEYEVWLTANGFEDAGSADDLMYAEILTTAQRRWLSDFILRWEAASERVAL